MSQIIFIICIVLYGRSKRSEHGPLIYIMMWYCLVLFSVVNEDKDFCNGFFFIQFDYFFLSF